MVLYHHHILATGHFRTSVNSSPANAPIWRCNLSEEAAIFCSSTVVIKTNSHCHHLMPPIFFLYLPYYFVSREGEDVETTAKQWQYFAQTNQDSQNYIWELKMVRTLGGHELKYHCSS